MLMIKAFHIIAMVAWFAGLFYLPRLFVYHSKTMDELGLARFIVMEKRLYYAITWPSAILTTVFGFWLLSFQVSFYLQAFWMQIKLALVLLLWCFHLACGHYLKQFARGMNKRSTRFFRFFNEIPTVLLVAIVLLVELQ